MGVSSLRVRARHGLALPRKGPAMNELVAILRSYSFRCVNEAELQGAVKTVLSTAKIAYEREVSLSPRERVDFLIAGGIALELKVRTNGKALMEQAARYAASERVNSILIASTDHRGLSLPSTINGKVTRCLLLRTL